MKIQFKFKKNENQRSRNVFVHVKIKQFELVKFGFRETSKCLNTKRFLLNI